MKDNLDLPGHAAPPSRGLALRYRPRKFAELTGQQHVRALLGRLIETDRIPRQLLLSGGSGLGKTTVGRIVAAAVLCDTPLEERDTADACGTCASCGDITGEVSRHPDVIELDAASNGGKDEIRQIAARAELIPMRGRFKIYIIDEVHAISGPGGQAFLKLLEEPPAHVIFVLCTTNPEKLSSGAGGNGTIRGRCTELTLRRPTDRELVTNLQRIAAAEQLEVPERIFDAAVRATDPDLGVRGTVMTFEKVASFLQNRDSGEASDDAIRAAFELLGLGDEDDFADLFDSVAAHDRPGALSALDALRRRIDDAAVRRRLLDWASTQLRTHVHDEAAASLAASRLHLLASAAAGAAHTDVAVSRLCRPDLDTDPTTQAHLVAVAQETLAELTEAIDIARNGVKEMIARTDALAPTQHTAPAGPQPGPSPSEPAGESTAATAQTRAAPDSPAGRRQDAPSLREAADAIPPPPDEPLFGDEDGDDTGAYDFSEPPPFDAGPSTPPTRRRAPSRKKTGAPTSAHKEASPSGDDSPPRIASSCTGSSRGETGPSSTKGRSLVETVAKKDEGLAQILLACKLQFTSNKTIIEAPTSDIAKRLAAPQLYSTLATAARSVGGGRVKISSR